MWLIVMFDLPTTTKVQKRRYSRFRGLLLDEGFRMLQYSVYGRHQATREKTDATVKRVVRGLPPGEVRILRVTEAQFARMQIYSNLEQRQAESAPGQLELW